MREKLTTPAPRRLEHSERAAIDLGSGKPMLVEKGRLDPAYQLAVPKELDEAR